MINIQVKSDRDPNVLARLIESTDGTAVDPSLAAAAAVLRAHQEQAERERPSRDTLETVNFSKIDDNNDWTDL